MADIELVIKIPEDTYKDIIKNGFIYDEDNEVVTHAIKKGTPHENVTKFADRCRECGRERVLDEIRAEIEEIAMNLTYKENHEVGGSWGLRKALEVIDKYKVEADRPKTKAGKPLEENDSGYNCENWIP